MSDQCNHGKYEKDIVTQAAELCPLCMADEIGGLRAQLAKSEDLSEQRIQAFRREEDRADKLGREVDDLRDQLASARKALEEIIDAEKEFREQMGADWEGDPVSDACDRAKLLLTDDTGNS
jgi:DNA repair exonuclease SbcCD ATPase subunit